LREYCYFLHNGEIEAGNWLGGVSRLPFIITTSNVPARGAGTLFTGAQRPALVSATPGESTPKVMTTGKTTATPEITFFANC